MVLKTHLGRSRFGFRNTISLSGLRSDGRQMGFRWASDASPMSLRCFSDDSFRAKEWVVMVEIIQLADRLQIAPGGAKIRFCPNDLDTLKPPLPDVADEDRGGLR